MKLVLCTQPRNPGAWLLRFVMWSKWSHSAIWDDERGVVVDSTFWGGGVKETPADKFFAKYTVSESRELHVPADKLEEARQWLRDQLNKKYDWTALLSWVVRRDWQQDDKWFCSELTEAFRTLFERARFAAKVSRITPQHQEMVL